MIRAAKGAGEQPASSLMVRIQTKLIGLQLAHRSLPISLSLSLSRFLIWHFVCSPLQSCAAAEPTHLRIISALTNK